VTTNKPIDIDAYIAEFPAEVQAVLEQVRSMIQKKAPASEEATSYGMPAFKLNVLRRRPCQGDTPSGI